MFVLSVNVWVKPEFRQQFIEATLGNARGTRQEPGNLRFDVSHSDEDPNRFLLYEVYREKADFERHQQTEHYLRWREAVKDWMAQPRQGTRYSSVFPEPAGW